MGMIVCKRCGLGDLEKDPLLPYLPLDKKPGMIELSEYRWLHHYCWKASQQPIADDPF